MAKEIFFTFLKKGRKTTSLEEWIKEKIKDGYIHHFEYNEFSQIIEIGSGAFGKVSKANFANRGLVALKTISSKNSKEKFDETNDEFIKELKLLREVDYHPNINRILGIAKDSEHYMLVLEYANEGNLSDYLKKSSTLKWDYKIQMALDITSGEKPIEGTPPEYQQLYQKCWDGEPKSRPDIEEVYETLSRLNSDDFLDLQSPQPNPPNIDNRNNDSNVDGLCNIFNLDNIKIDSRDQLVEEGGNGKVRNLLIIGRTLSGKTTLSSVLCDTDDFRKNGNTINETKSLRKKDFEWKGTKYYVIEIGVESIKKKDFYNEIIELMAGGISQVLFVSDKSFTTEEKKTLELYEKIIFETGILEYVTIVRNKFENFRNKNECEKDKKYVFEENEIIAKIVKSCNNIIYIDNPPIYIYDDNDYGNAREESRTILLNYLENVCGEKYYKLIKWDDLHSKIVNYTESNKNFAAKLEKADITISTGTKTQQWFNEKYSKKENIDIAESKNLKLKGFLEIKDFTKLKSIILKNFELNKLEISGCSQLAKVDLSELVKLRNLTVTKCPNITTLNYSTELTSLGLSGSQLKEIDLSKLTKLTSLSVTDCQKLTGLDCSSTKLSSLKIINCPQLNKIIDRSKTKTKSLYARGYSNLSTLDCLETGFTNLEINGCSQLNEVDLSKLPKITSLSVIDCSNLSNLDCSSTGLTSLKISGCYRLEKFNCSNLPKLTSLSVIGCLKLTKLDCSNSEITDLEVSDLTELNCSNTSIKELSLNLCPYITKLDCSNNKNLKNLDISNCFKLGSINCSNSKLTSLDISYCPELEGKNIPCVTITQKKENVKNILIVGRAGGGKSTLANVLTNTDEFKESAYAVSETKIFRKKEFKWNWINFRVVDTIGAGDTKLGLKDVLYKIADGIYAMPEGISQILYVVDGRFTEEEISTFNMIEDSILQDKINIIGYVTLVRTKFDEFRSTEECKRDKEKMLKENENIAKIVRKCNDVIHVDNPPMNSDFYDDDDDDDEYISYIKINRHVRQKSRQKLLEYLEGVDPVKKNKYFKLKTWDKLRENISEYVKNNEDALKMLENEPELEAVYNASKGCLIM
ncbi:unnamed protein product [Rhizophagus irregularis]|nr:unnamed protein product [Rhizophagus irregularis]